ncbi:hypothetical protein GCM10017744_043950 [Streptomyces antimycoticus]
MARIRVLVVDDHRIFAESLAAALAAEQDVDVAAAGSGPAALRCLERAAAEGRRFDILLVDADLGTAAEGAGPPLPVPAEVAYGGANGTPHNGIHGGPHGGPARVVNGRAADGIWLVGAVRSTQPGVRTVVLAERDDPRRAAVALQAGASGWVAKDCSLVRLLAVIRGVLGRRPICRPLCSPASCGS